MVMMCLINLDLFLGGANETTSQHLDWWFIDTLKIRWQNSVEICDVDNQLWS
jgi:hypothetical protein